MGKEETIALRSLDDQVSAPGITGIKPKAARQPGLAEIGWVPSQGWLVCWWCLTLEVDIGEVGSGSWEVNKNRQREIKRHVSAF